MVELSQGWRRRCGIVTLIAMLACIAGWVRSQSVQDDIAFSLGRTNQIHLLSTMGLIACGADHDVGGDVMLTRSWVTRSLDAQPSTTPPDPLMDQTVALAPEPGVVTSAVIDGTVVPAAFEVVTEGDDDAESLDSAGPVTIAGASPAPIGLDFNYSEAELFSWHRQWYDITILSDGTWWGQGVIHYGMLVLPLFALSAWLLIKPRAMERIRD